MATPAQQAILSILSFRFTVTGSPPSRTAGTFQFYLLDSYYNIGLYGAIESFYGLSILSFRFGEFAVLDIVVPETLSILSFRFLISVITVT